MKRLSSISAIVGSLVMASAFGVACSTSHNRDEDTLGPPLGQSTAGGPSDPTAPTPAPPTTEAPPVERVPMLSHPPTGPAPVGAPAPTAAETFEPPSPSPTPPDTANPAPVAPVPTAPPATPMPAPSVPPSMIPMGETSGVPAEPFQARLDGGLPVVPQPVDAGVPAPVRDAGPGTIGRDAGSRVPPPTTPTGDGGVR